MYMLYKQYCVHGFIEKKNSRIQIKNILGYKSSKDPMAISFFMLFLLPILLSVGSESTADHHHGVHIIQVSSLLPASTCSSTPSIEGLEGRSLLQIVHRHGPCTSLFHNEGQEKSNSSAVFSSEEFLDHDRVRVEWLHLLLSNKSKTAQEQSSKGAVIPANTGIPLGTGNYIVKVGFGTPTKYMSLIFDTGSDLTWIQCKPCVKFCHEQQDPIFSPFESTSYSNVTCNTTECSLLKGATGVSPSCSSLLTCIYGIQYGDRSFSIGYFGREAVSLTPKDVFSKIQFGCGQYNQGLFGKAAGLLGLGRSKISFVSQTFKKYKGRFSYCLPSTSSSTGYLTFGAKKGFASSVKFTPMVNNPRDPSFYFLDVTAISVGGDKLAIPASVFASTGTIIDSGTVVSRLPRTVYTALRSAFRKHMSSYPSAKPFSILDTCYNVTGLHEVTVPNIVLYFKGGAALDIDPSGILLAVDSAQLCLAFAGNVDDNDLGIIGNKQQQKLEVIYDGSKNRVGFGKGVCM